MFRNRFKEKIQIGNYISANVYGACVLTVTCNSCTDGKVACNHGEMDPHTYTVTCSTCNGVGSIWNYYRHNDI